MVPVGIANLHAVLIAPMTGIAPTLGSRSVPLPIRRGATQRSHRETYKQARDFGVRLNSLK